ncbi:Maph116 [Matsumuraeses phaseoli granulovirus]|uniref:Maph116 n=1 Tax=Matsumuraeses phaseoli granulovirus TaxID=2760664 RepID=A0AAE7MLH5_9BBAC|nr:Maph116 [Matsumuraeses phaseoli granulovirus]QOD40079.1 Maph116 [Matsumuraeses phaseoli granulovirus]
MAVQNKSYPFIMLFLLIFIAIFQLSKTTTFPPLHLNNTSGLSINPEFYDIYLYTDNSSKHLTHTHHNYGDRLKMQPVNTTTRPAKFQLFAVNNGYVLTCSTYLDQLCFSYTKVFKMLTRPASRNLPHDCIMFFETTEPKPRQVHYMLTNNTKQLCIKNYNTATQGFKFKLYTLFKSIKYYVVVDSSLYSTTNTNNATVFEAKLLECKPQGYNNIGSQFSCYIDGKRPPCQNERLLNVNINMWYSNKIESLKTIITTTDTTSTTTFKISTKSTTITPLIVSTTKQILNNIAVNYSQGVITPPHTPTKFSFDKPVTTTTSSWFDVELFVINNNCINNIVNVSLLCFSIICVVVYHICIN